jgi:hypothetical protein
MFLLFKKKDNINIINFTEDGVAHNASRALMFYNGKFKTFSEANNG